jgi:transposase-like protein
VKRTYSDEQRAMALALYAECGARETSRKMAEQDIDVHEATIRSWARKGNVETKANENRSAVVVGNRLTIEARKQALADGLLEDAMRLRGQLFAPTMVHSFGGPDHNFDEARINEPTFRDKQAILTTIGIAVDKIQILTGGATSREEHVMRDRQALEARAAELDELATRRASRGAA